MKDRLTDTIRISQWLLSTENSNLGINYDTSHHSLTVTIITTGRRLVNYGKYLPTLSSGLSNRTYTFSSTRYNVSIFTFMSKLIQKLLFIIGR